MTQVRDKYDRLAAGFAEKSYANLEFYMLRRFLIATRWGTPLQPGDFVLEIGCADGYLAKLFIRRGYHYRGVDLSEEMLVRARRRLHEEGLPHQSTFVAADLNEWIPEETHDAVVCFMRTFFGYVREPRMLLAKLRPLVRKKVIVDLNARRNMSVGEAIALIKSAGFRHVSWRPFLVPQRVRLPRLCLHGLACVENVPVLRSFPLIWKFHCLLKAEP